MIQEYLKAGYPALLVRTHEPERFISSMVQQNTGRTPYQWDFVRGFRELGNGAEWQESDPFDLPNVAGKGKDQTVWFLRNYHFWLSEPPVIQAIQNNLPVYKTKGITLVIVSPETKLPLELEREVVVLDFPLPSRDELKSILAGLVESTGIEPEEEEEVLGAAQGLTWEEAENALALALVRQKRFDAGTITDLKAQTLEAVGLRLLKSENTFENLIGLEVLKEDVLDTFKYSKPGVPIRGLLLLGTPGNGKTHFAEALGSALGCPVIILPLDQMQGSLVGESERKLTAALKAIDAFGRCVVVVDEIEKALAGVGSGSSTDGGTTQRWGSIFLKWLNDRTSEAYVIATCNDYSKLPAEYTRAGRWDGIYFVDGPNRDDARKILDLYLKQYVGQELNSFPMVPDLDGYSGAEIRQIAIKTVHKGGDMMKAFKCVIPQSRANKQDLDALRDWAKARTIPASRPEKEDPNPGFDSGGRRKRRLQV